MGDNDACDARKGAECRGEPHIPLEWVVGEGNGVGHGYSILLQASDVIKRGWRLDIV